MFHVEHSVVTVMGMRYRAYNNVMTYKRKKAKRQKARARPGESGPLRASVEDGLGLLADEDTGGGSRWNRPRRPRISLRVDIEVLDWFKSKGPGYQPRINRILRRVMIESKKRTKRDKTMQRSYSSQPHPRKPSIPRQLLCCEKYASTYSATSNFWHNEDFIDYQQVEVWSRIERQERNFAASVIHEVMLGVMAPRTVHCSVTERVVNYRVRISNLDDLNFI